MFFRRLVAGFPANRSPGNARHIPFFLHAWTSFLPVSYPCILHALSSLHPYETNKIIFAFGGEKPEKMPLLLARNVSLAGKYCLISINLLFCSLQKEQNGLRYSHPNDESTQPATTICCLAGKEGGLSKEMRHGNLADGVGFEPTVSCPTPVFKTGALNRSATHPHAEAVIYRGWGRWQQGE